jgi:hypothetical protein
MDTDRDTDMLSEGDNDSIRSGSSFDDDAYQLVLGGEKTLLDVAIVDDIYAETHNRQSNQIRLSAR